MSYILIVDDNKDTREILTRAFERVGLACSTADDGEQALARVRADPPALIISDLMMPRMSGFSLLGHLQRDSSTAGIPIIFLSGIANPQLGQLPGVVKVIQKGDLDLKMLRDYARRLLAPAKAD